jgi:DNA processing protein
MALGIDSCAHEGALAAGGLTVAVLGSGPDVPHPPSKRNLYERIATRGLVLSELEPGTPPMRHTFPARNRLMAALAAMSIVVEARLPSGSLITAARAAELGREVGAVPGRVGARSAEGTNQLLREGAQVIRTAEDVLDSLVGAGAASTASLRPEPELDPDEAAVLDAIEGGAETLDALARESCLDPGAVAVALTRLELAELVAVDGAGRYRRTTKERRPIPD